MVKWLQLSHSEGHGFKFLTGHAAFSVVLVKMSTYTFFESEQVKGSKRRWTRS